MRNATAKTPRRRTRRWCESPFSHRSAAGFLSRASTREGIPAIVGARRDSRTSIRAFSLAEMMIALAILGLGLLVIGAALPIGLRYTRDSVNIATGQAAAEYGLDLIAQNVCLPRTIYDPNTPLTPTLIRAPGLFQPRAMVGGETFNLRNYASAEFIPDYEPVIKVRPLYTRAIDMANIEVAESTSGIFGENAVRNWMNGMVDPKESDSEPWIRAALSSVATAYPPITPSGGPVNSPNSTEYTPAAFLSALGGNEYARWQVGTETRKVIDNLTSWTAFYRRVSYDDPNTVGNESDPTLYEFIAVAVRRPSLKHRFPVQNPGSEGMQTFSASTALVTAAPVPWLISFLGDPATGVLPVPSSGFDTNGFPALGPSPATLTFTCDASFTGLLPVGSILIPARNDVAPSNPMLTGATPVNFGPPAPSTLPIYEVVQRPNDTSVVVKFNGYYPRQGTFGVAPTDWPVWVIPPAYEEGTSSNPAFGDKSPILAVARRYVRLREIP